MSAVFSLPIPGNIQVVVPQDFSLMTPYILFEQQDWFEAELPFLRHAAKSGWNVVDIGANYGTYTLTIAAAIAPGGRLWAFEPTAATAACLRRSLALNHADNVTLIQAGLSNRGGSATFYTQPNGELNSLTPEPNCVEETIQLTTLDAVMAEAGWPRIDFIKLDAEKEEVKILQGAHNTLTGQSPLIMFECKCEGGFNRPLIDELHQLGCSFFRLVPATNTLIPFDPGTEDDSFMINLFACNAARAAELEAQGILLRGRPEPSEVPADFSAAAQLFFALHSAAADNRRRTAQLWNLADFAVNRVKLGQSGVEELAACIRFLLEFGRREAALNLADLLKNRIAAGAEVDPRHLPIAPYPGLPPRSADANPRNWLYAAILYTILKTRAFSTYYTGMEDLELIQAIINNGIMTEELARRQLLIRKRFAL